MERNPVPQLGAWGAGWNLTEEKQDCRPVSGGPWSNSSRCPPLPPPESSILLVYGCGALQFYNSNEASSSAVFIRLDDLSPQRELQRAGAAACSLTGSVVSPAGAGGVSSRGPVVSPAGGRWCVQQGAGIKQV
ncbi:unnamed protein product [Pleuronectes platessa]|uniref:Uncharacterized protein n=1 Tax=Pleuronectes platessa TaxID=8262 RepID=A0A9N7YDQ6_PLEPL|nr:unnamed protein product [Pleuronectes platessa]